MGWAQGLADKVIGGSKLEIEGWELEGCGLGTGGLEGRQPGGWVSVPMTAVPVLASLSSRSTICSREGAMLIQRRQTPFPHPPGCAL